MFTRKLHVIFCRIVFFYAYADIFSVSVCVFWSISHDTVTGFVVRYVL